MILKANQSTLLFCARTQQSSQLEWTKRSTWPNNICIDCMWISDIRIQLSRRTGNLVVICVRFCLRGCQL